MKNYVKSRSGVPYILQSRHLVEGCLESFREGKLVRFECPNTMTRAAVRKAVLGPKYFEFAYSRYVGLETTETGFRNKVAIRFGCTIFSFENYKKLRAWALRKAR